MKVEGGSIEEAQVNLSWSQEYQVVVIVVVARDILSNPEVLFFEEVSSALNYRPNRYGRKLSAI